MVTITASKARAVFPELLNRVNDGEEIMIFRHGQLTAILVRPDVLRRRRAEATLADAERVHELITEAAAAPLLTSAGLTSERSDQLINEIRVEREAGR